MHQPRRGSCLARPKVHAGFQRCWTYNGFHENVKRRIKGLLSSGQLEDGNVRFYVTGESLCDQPHTGQIKSACQHTKSTC